MKILLKSKPLEMRERIMASDTQFARTLAEAWNFSKTLPESEQAVLTPLLAQIMIAYNQGMDLFQEVLEAVVAHEEAQAASRH